MRTLFDHALFWAAIGGSVVVVGGSLGAVGVAVVTTSTPSKSVWDEGWFVGGCVVVGIGVLVLNWAVVLFVSHRHFSKHVDELRASPQTQIHVSPQGSVPFYMGTATAVTGPQASSHREGLVSPEELGEYLDSINKTMESHGFGRNPNLLTPSSNPAQDRRAALIVRGLQERTQVGNPGVLSPSMAAVIGFPRATQWLSEAQAYLHEIGSGDADSTMARAYSDRREVIAAIDATLRALRDAGTTPPA